jgi:transposase
MKKRRSSSDKIASSKTSNLSRKERPMNSVKYIGMDVHKATTVIAVLNDQGKVVQETIIETKQEAILDFLKSQRGTLHVTFEEGTQAAWLYDMIQPNVDTIVVCDPKKIVGQGRKADKPDAKRLAELLRNNSLVPVYHGEQSMREIKELTRSYVALVGDCTRVKNRLKALFRGRGIDCDGRDVYDQDERKEWISKLNGEAVRVRAERLYDELKCLAPLCEEAETQLLAEARKHPAMKILKSIPGLGPVRSAVILGLAVTPFRFRTKRQFWTYSGLGIVTKTSSEYIVIDGQVRRSNKQPMVRGLNRNYNRALKWVFKGAAKTVSSGAWKLEFEAMIAKGTPKNLARLTFARKIASITLALWKKGERYDNNKLKFKHAA